MASRSARRTLTRPVAMYGASALIGVVFGAIAVLCDTRDASIPTIIGIVVNAAFVWGGFGFLVGAATAKRGGSWWESALAALFALAGAVVGYYGFDVMLRENLQPEFNIDDLVGYGRESLIVGPILGLLGWWWVRTPAGALGALALVASQLYVSGAEVRGSLSMQARELHSDSEVEPIVANGILMGVGAVMIVLLIGQWRRRTALAVGRTGPITEMTGDSTAGLGGKTR